MDKVFKVSFTIGIIYAFLSPLMILVAMAFSAMDNMFAAKIFMYGMYFGLDALIGTFIGVLAGFHLKTRFYAPFFIAAVILPLSAKLFGDAAVMLKCAGITLAAGIVAMTLSVIKNR